jgi:ubiquinone/menaquinone biosynthesis C-methylase UbiE
MDKSTIETYNQMASEYDNETITFWEEFPKEIIDKFIQLAPEKSVLDVGSGPGRDGLILKYHGIDVTCLDASSSMVELCLKRGLNAVLGDLNKMPFDSESFDGVWAYTSLLHIHKAEIDDSLDEIDRVLKTNGIFGLGMIEGDTEGYRESAGVNKPRWFSYYSEDEIRTLLEKHGFEILYFSKFQPKTSSYLNFIGRKLGS